MMPSTTEPGVPLLRVRDLKVAFDTPAGTVQAVDGVSFTVEAGRGLGRVGESGSGQSVSSRAVMGLHQRAQVSGSFPLAGQDVLPLTDHQSSRLRGRKMAMVFQAPLSALHPA